MKTITKEVSIINEGTLTFPILPNGSGWKSTENENLSVVESGEGKILFSKILRMIEKAKQIICLQSFLIQDSEIIDALIRAVKNRNVKLYLLSSAEARLKETIEEEEDFIRPRYIELLDKKFKNNFVHRVAENFHAKYILIDPRTEPQGFLCTSNFTDNGFFKSPELAVELSEGQVTELFKIFVYHFWEFATDEQTSGKEFDKVQPAKRFKLSETKEILLTSPNDKLCSLNTRLLSSINEAQKSICISTYIFDKNSDLVKAVIAKAKENIPVTLFCRSIEWLYKDDIKDLVSAGVKVIMHPLMHGKSLLVDDTIGFIFTANLIEKGLRKGFEVGLQLNDKQVRDLNRIQQSWVNSFPYKVVQLARVKDLSQVFEFNKGKPEQRTVNEEQKEIQKKVQTVSELKSLFAQELPSAGRLTKLTKYKLMANLENLPSQYKPSNTDPFEVIERENGKKEKEKVVALRNSFDVAAISQLENYLGLRVYCQ